MTGLMTKKELLEFTDIDPKLLDGFDDLDVFDTTLSYAEVRSVITYYSYHYHYFYVLIDDNLIKVKVGPGFLFPRNELELARFDKLYAESLEGITGKEIDPDKIINDN